MDTLLYSRDKRTVENKFFREEGKDGEISRQGDDHNFLGCVRIINIHYLERRLTINGEYYAVLMHQLSKEIKKKYSHLS